MTLTAEATVVSCACSELETKRINSRTAPAVIFLIVFIFAYCFIIHWLVYASLCSREILLVKTHEIGFFLGGGANRVDLTYPRKNILLYHHDTKGSGRRLRDGSQRKYPVAVRHQSHGLSTQSGGARSGYHRKAQQSVFVVYRYPNPAKKNPRAPRLATTRCRPHPYDPEKTRNMEKKSFILIVIRFALVALWVPVAVDKLWNLSGFHGTLLRQPLPDRWADILFWLLPLLEMAAAVLIAWPQNTSGRGVRADDASQSKFGIVHHPLRLGLALSTLLMLAFTLFILFGVLGWYAKRPCGCGSVISGLTWEQHLWFNIGFLLISMAGLWLTRPSADQNPTPPNMSSRRHVGSLSVQLSYDKTAASQTKTLFPRKFAVFRRRAVP